MKTLSLSNFEFIPIPDGVKESFKCAQGTLSDFYAFAICMCADAIANTHTIWCDNKAWWDTFQRREAIYMTDNGILVLQELEL